MENSIYRVKFIILVFITTMLMGSSFAIGKIGLTYASPLLFVAIRFVLAGLLMISFVLAWKRKHPTTFNQWLKMAIIGFFQTSGVMGFVFLSLEVFPSSETSILTFTNPLFVILFGTLFLGAHYQLHQWLGLVVGIVGVGVILGGISTINIGIIYGLLAAVSWAIATLLVKIWGREFNTWVLTAYQMFFGGIFLFLPSFYFERSFFIFNLNSIALLLWLSIMASIVQFAVWYYLLARTDPGKTSAFLFLAPLFGVISGWILLDEPISLSLILGGGFILMGIYLINRTFTIKAEET